MVLATQAADLCACCYDRGGAGTWCEPPGLGRGAVRVMVELRAAGRDTSHGGEAARKRGATHREQLRLNSEWEANNIPTMTDEEYRAGVSNVN
jgi:hypothetical protein